MYKRAKNFTLARPALKKTLGWIVVVVGLAALVLPLVPGIVLLILGFELLGFRLIFFERFMRKGEVPVTIEK